MTDLVKAIFRNRANRFIAEVEIDGEIVRAHLPNTGRCKELLIDGVTVYLKPSDNPNRKTKYSLHLIENNGVLVAMYSQEASKIVIDAILNGKVKELSGYDIVESEKTIGNSRIDIYLANLDEDDNPIDETYVEVKSVTLIKDGNDASYFFSCTAPSADFIAEYSSAPGTSKYLVSLVLKLVIIKPILDSSLLIDVTPVYKNTSSS